MEISVHMVIQLFLHQVSFGGVAGCCCRRHIVVVSLDIDGLAVGGTKFTQFYSTYPICTPSRSGLLTGRIFIYPFHARFVHFIGRLPVRNGIFTSYEYPLDMVFRVFLPNSEGGLPADEITMPQLLKQANYRSALVRDKWMDG